MRTIDVDARRYAWTHGHAMWRMGLPIVALLEDMRGGLAAEQDGLVRHTARTVGQNCAVVLNMVLNHERPLPPPRMRVAWALERLSGHELGGECWELVRSSYELTPAELVARSERLVERVREVVGEIPDPLSPEGYYPALAFARDWLTFIDAMGEEGFLPKEWTRSQQGEARA
ncbi:MAG TPA: hypothetical protein VF517_18495 [Thermoleophilaceae bacterium]